MKLQQKQWWKIELAHDSKAWHVEFQEFQGGKMSDIFIFAPYLFDHDLWFVSQ